MSVQGRTLGGNLDQRVNPGHALGHIAKIGACRNHLGNNPTRQHRTSDCVLRPHPSLAKRTIGTHRHFIGGFTGKDLHPTAGGQGGAPEHILHPRHQVAQRGSIQRAHNHTHFCPLRHHIRYQPTVGNHRVHTV